MSAVYDNRLDAGRQLGLQLRNAGYDRKDVVVIALPRGGVPVAYEVAKTLGAPLDVFIVRKIGAPMHPEFGVGALCEDGTLVIDEDVVSRIGAHPEQVKLVVKHEYQEARRRVLEYRGGRSLTPVQNRTVIVVDDGLATGVTAHVACMALKKQGAERVIMAVPVASKDAVIRLRAVTDAVVCLSTPPAFMAVGQWYVDFHQVTDAEVVGMLAQHLPAAKPTSTTKGGESGRLQLVPSTVAPQSTGGAEPMQAPATSHTPAPPGGTPATPPPTQIKVQWAADPARDPDQRDEGKQQQEVEIVDGSATVAGTLTTLPDALGLVVFAHGSFSSRLSPRNVAVASELNASRISTLLMDLLTDAEAQDRRNVFNIQLLAHRLCLAVDWLQRHGYVDPERGRGVGLFGASTGAAAALWAAAELDGVCQAVVSRGGRPDLAMARLHEVAAPTLLIVGGNDKEVIECNRLALQRLGGTSRLSIVPRATHLFEEPGALERVAAEAADWFTRHLARDEPAGAMEHA